MAIETVDNSSPTSGDLNDAAWSKYNAAVTALLLQHDSAGSHRSAGDALLKALFDANTILVADADDTPAALVIPASRILGRAASGNIAALTATQIKTLLDIYDASVSLTNVSSKKLQDLFDGGYDVPIKPSNIITKGPWVDVRAYASFSAAIDDIGASEKTLLITEDTVVADNKTVPANVLLKFTRTGKLTIANTKTLTIVGNIIDAGRWQIFAGDGTVANTKEVDPVYPEWFGAVGDYSTDCSPALADVLTYINAHGGTIRLGAGVFKCNSQWDFSSYQASEPLRIVGSGIGKVCILSFQNAGWAINMDLAEARYMTIIEGFYLDCDGATTNGMYLKNLQNGSVVRDIRIGGAYKYGIEAHSENYMVPSLDNVWIVGDAWGEAGSIGLNFSRGCAKYISDVNITGFETGMVINNVYNRPDYSKFFGLMFEYVKYGINIGNNSNGLVFHGVSFMPRTDGKSIIIGAGSEVMFSGIVYFATDAELVGHTLIDNNVTGIDVTIAENQHAIAEGNNVGTIDFYCSQGLQETVWLNGASIYATTSGRPGNKNNLDGWALAVNEDLYFPFPIPSKIGNKTVVIDEITIHFNTVSATAGQDYIAYSALWSNNLDGSYVPRITHNDDLGNGSNGNESHQIVDAPYDMLPYPYFLIVDISGTDAVTDVKIRGFQIKYRMKS